MLAGMLRHIYLDVVNRRLIDVGGGGSGDVRGAGSGWDRVRGDGFNQIVLQLHQFGSRLHDNARQAQARQRRGSKIVIFVGLQLEAGNIVTDENFVGGRVNLVEVRRADVTLQHQDVG